MGMLLAPGNGNPSSGDVDTEMIFLIVRMFGGKALGKCC